MNSNVIQFKKREEFMPPNKINAMYHLGHARQYQDQLNDMIDKIAAGDLHARYMQEQLGTIATTMIHHLDMYDRHLNNKLNEVTNI